MELPANPITTTSPPGSAMSVSSSGTKEPKRDLSEITTRLHSVSQILGKAASATRGNRETESALHAVRVPYTSCTDIIREIEKVKGPEKQEKKIAFLRSAVWVGAVAFAVFSAAAAVVTFPVVPAATVGALVLLVGALALIKGLGETFGEDAGVIDENSSGVKKAIVAFGLAPLMPFYELYQEGLKNEELMQQAEKKRGTLTDQLELKFEDLKKAFTENEPMMRELLSAKIKTESNDLSALEKKLQELDIKPGGSETTEKLKERNSLQEQYADLALRKDITLRLLKDLHNLGALFRAEQSNK